METRAAKKLKLSKAFSRLPDHVFSCILEFVDLNTFAVVALVSKRWKKCLESVEQDVFQNISKAQYPRVVELKELLPPTPNVTWRQLLKQYVKATPWGMNQQLQRDLETVFRHEGITAFSNFCIVNGTANYSELPGFRGRMPPWNPYASPENKHGGIYFIKVFFNGENYHDSVDTAHAGYFDLDYLLENWETECEVLKRWCAVAGVEEYEVIKPESINECVQVKFKEPLALEKETFWGDHQSDY